MGRVLLRSWLPLHVPPAEFAVSSRGRRRVVYSTDCDYAVRGPESGERRRESDRRAGRGPGIESRGASAPIFALRCGRTMERRVPPSLQECQYLGGTGKKPKSLWSPRARF